MVLGESLASQTLLLTMLRTQLSRAAAQSGRQKGQRFLVYLLDLRLELLHSNHFFLLSHHHSTSALVSEILMSMLQTVQKNNRQFTYGQTVQKNNRQFTYGQTVQKNNKQFTYGQTVQKKIKIKKNLLHMDRQCKKTALEHLQCSRQCKKKQQQQFTYGQTVQKSNSNLHMDRQCKKATAIYIWTVHIYRLYRRQCAKYTYIYSVHIVYYRDILNYQRHIIHRMGTSTLCTVSIHNVVYT